VDSRGLRKKEGRKKERNKERKKEIKKERKKERKKEKERKKRKKEIFFIDVRIGLNGGPTGQLPGALGRHCNN